MPDLRTEMTKVINQWETPNKEENKMQQPYRTFSEQVFDVVKANPRISIKQIRSRFVGSQAETVSSTLTTLFNRGILGREEVYNPNYEGMGKKTHYLYTALTDECITQVKGYTSQKNKKPGRPMGSTNKPKENLPQITVTSDNFPRKIDVFNAEEYVEKLSVTQAKAVYLALKNIFDPRLV